MTTLFDFGMIHDDPNVWDVIPDIEFTIDSYGGSLVFYYGVCDISTKYPWCITPDHEVFE